MFEQAIERAAEFTRPIHSISRHYRSEDIHAGCATLFFVNAEGWAFTCKHVTQLLRDAEALIPHYNAFKAEFAQLTKSKKARAVLPGLEKKYNLDPRHIVELKNCFVDCITGKLNARIYDHPDVDLALLKFSGFDALTCKSFPTFPRDTTPLKPGMLLCRLGFPFAEFNNFAYDATADKIDWTATGQQSTPRFPLDGMVTRLIRGNLGGAPGIPAFEMSTPGLRGQSGGPAIDTQGRVWGVQFATNPLHLGFDVETEISKEGRKVKVKDSAFLHVGHVVHVDVMKAFMRQHGVTFQEG